MTIDLYTQLFALGLGLAFLYIALRAIVKRKQNAFARECGCAPAPLTNPKALFGFRLMKSLLDASKKGSIPIFYAECLDAVEGDAHTVRAKMLGSQLLITRDNDNIKAVMSSQHDDFKLGTLRGDIFRKFLGATVFVLEGQPWKRSRSLIRPALAREPVSNLAMYERHLQSSFAKIFTDEKGWTKVVDLEPTFGGLTLDIITELLYGYSTHVQNPQKRSQLGAELGTSDLPDAQAFIDNLKQVGTYINFTAMFGKWYNFAATPKYYQIRRAVRRYPDWFVRRRLDQMSKSKAAPEPESKERFILLHEFSKAVQDPIRLRTETISLLSAGHSSTASLLGWVIYHLARNPRVFNKLRDAVISDFGEDFDIQRTGFSELRNCTYMQHCVNEGLRLGSVQPAVSREAAKNTTLPSGGGPEGRSPIFVPKGTTVVLHLFGLHHRSDIWGSDVEDFRPERWENVKTDAGFFPFGVGPRRCIGEQLALTEACYVITRIVQRFDKIENMDPVDHVVNYAAIGNRSGTGIVVKMHRAGAMHDV